MARTTMTMTTTTTTTTTAFIPILTSAITIMRIAMRTIMTDNGGNNDGNYFDDAANGIVLLTR